MKQDFQYSVKLWLFDDQTINIQLIIMLPFQHYPNNVRLTG